MKLFHGKENQPEMFTRTKDHVFSAFLEITEDDSDIASYSIGVATYPEGDDVLSHINYKLNAVTNFIRVNWTSTKTSSLVNGQKYYITVKSANTAGLLSIVSSPPLIFDNESPLVPHVLDGWGRQDVQYHPFPNIYRMHWPRVTDVTGIEDTKVCLSSTTDESKCDLHSIVKNFLSCDVLHIHKYRSSIRDALLRFAASKGQGW